MKNSKLKIGQNDTVVKGKFTIVTTMTKMFVYIGEKLVGSAGVLRGNDFDFETLFKLSLHEPTLTVG